MTANSKYVFHGDHTLHPPSAHKDSPEKAEPYLASPQLIHVVNQAIKYRRPLLLEGEAGCGKTRLAWAVAYELGLPLYPWYIRSTTKAGQGLYEYDYLSRLHEVQIYRLEAEQKLSDAEPGKERPNRRDPSDPSQYYELGPLGKAFEQRECPAVVLIDEIDKADLDFPNDLLHVLDEPWAFSIPEAGDTVIRAIEKPIVFITSNNERGGLPYPFLRRCFYHFIEFPDANRLKQIINTHATLDKTPPPQEELLSAAIERFITVRGDNALEKKPGTSEFMDWFRALQDQPAAPGKQGESIPYPEMLFKLRADWQRYTQRS